MKKNRSNRREIWQCHRFIAIGTRMRNELQKRWKMAAVLMPREVLQYAWIMPGKRYDIGDRKSYDEVCERFSLS